MYDPRCLCIEDLWDELISIIQPTEPNLWAGVRRGKLVDATVDLSMATSTSDDSIAVPLPGTLRHHDDGGGAHSMLEAMMHATDKEALQLGTIVDCPVLSADFARNVAVGRYTI